MKELDDRKRPLFLAVREHLGSDAPDPDLVRKSSLESEAPYWVTVTTGAAQWVDCTVGTKVKSVFFPIGLVLRPISELVVDGSVVTLFQTEYGLRVIIPREAIAPVTENDAYFFASGNSVYRVCKPGDTECEASYPLAWDQTRPENWPFVNGQFSYLYSEDAASAEAAHTAWLEFRSKQGETDPISNPFERYPETFDEVVACSEQRALLFSLKKSHDREDEAGTPEYPRPVRFRLCFRDPNDVIRTSPIKIVTKSIADSMYANLWSATAPTDLHGEIEDVIRAAYDYSGDFLTRIGCGDTPQVNNRITYGALVVGAQFSDQPTNLSEVLLEDQTARAREYHFKPFQTHMGLSRKDVVYDAPVFNDIELVIDCRGRTPSEPVELKIHYQPLFNDNPLRLDLIKLNEMYDTELDGYGEAADRVRKQRLSDGRLFRICDFNEYTIWRAVLHEALVDADRTRKAANSLGVSVQTMAEHFTHLIMASVFETDAKLRSRSNLSSTCES
ncbi:hypothetical protein ACERZ8_00965 [Tateyamaria armeniaca]|uniref:Uncharacterized protein n=1 Tax=Tateyamaria armeniaca TaxID=2518930 RepID=A0ABW8UN17_9RHOB